jgi:glutamyl-tRNA reductase
MLVLAPSHTRHAATAAAGPLTPIALGVDYAAAPVTIRERVAATDLASVLDQLRPQAAEAVVLSTCHRTELYLVGAERVESLIACLASAARLPADDLAAWLWLCIGPEAARHLFSVAAGVDSQLLGETVILRQVRTAYAAAQQAGTAGPILSGLFRHALRVGKRARAQTGISRGAASVGSAAVAVVRQELPPEARRYAVVVGAGEAARRALSHLRGLGFARVDVVNRTIARASRLVVAPGQAYGLDTIPGLLAEADAVLCATAAPGAVVGLDDAAAAVDRRGGRLLLLLDLAVPRDIDPAVADLRGVRLYDLHAIHARAAADRDRRGAEVGRVQALVEAETAAFDCWLRARQAAPTIRRVRAAAERRRQTELAVATRGLSARERAAVDRATRAVLNALLHGPTVALRRGEEALGKPLIEALERDRSSGVTRRSARATPEGRAHAQLSSRSRPMRTTSDMVVREPATVPVDVRLIEREEPPIR